MYYYFAFTNADPMQTAFKEAEITIEEMRKRYVGTWVQTGDEEHDADRVSDIWTSDRAKNYFAE